jgi:hypothetical protein
MLGVEPAMVGAAQRFEGSAFDHDVCPSVSSGDRLLRAWVAFPWLEEWRPAGYTKIENIETDCFIFYAKAP